MQISEPHDLSGHRAFTNQLEAQDIRRLYIYTDCKKTAKLKLKMSNGYLLLVYRLRSDPN